MPEEHDQKIIKDHRPKVAISATTTSADNQAKGAINTVREEFSLDLADTPELIREAHRLRYQVYCIENDYEEGLDGLEIDEFDMHSRHVILRDNATAGVVGTARLVLFEEDTPGASFPIQNVVPVWLGKYVPLHTTAEVSRLAISKWRRGEAGARAGMLRLGLVRGLVRLSAALGVTHWTALMEPALLRLLKTSAIHFSPIGRPVEYHGLRQPCYADVDVLLARVHAERRAIWDLLTDGGQSWSGAKKLPSRLKRLKSPGPPGLPVSRIRQGTPAPLRSVAISLINRCG
jgi:N-acyl-L-homoserine lactone synthetase